MRWSKRANDDHRRHMIIQLGEFEHAFELGLHALHIG